MPEKFLLSGEWRSSDDIAGISFPYDDSLVAEVCMATEEDLAYAVEAGQRGFSVTRKLPTYQRMEILRRLHLLLVEHYDALTELMIMESGKTRKTAESETTRACQTTLVASEEAGRMYGEIIDLDWTTSGADHRGFVRRFPIGLILGITPFNYPLNLALHKLAPAIASGNAIIMKPPEVNPLSSLKLAELVLEAGFPPEAFSMLPMPGLRTEKLVVDPRVAMVSFTGSARVGWHLKNVAGRKKVALELGGNAPVIVHEDADIELAVQKIVSGGFANAGQNCIAVQRVVIHQDIFEAFCEQFVAAVELLKVGDPRKPGTDIGPMISETAAERAELWVQEAIDAGATPLVRGERAGKLLPPIVLSDVDSKMKVCKEEIFAPVVTLASYKKWDDAVDIANDSQYGLQAGIFTNNMRLIMDAWERLEVGGIQVNNVSTFRVDHMPYGGVKASGFGREGIRYAIQEMTELRQLVINTGV